VKYRTHHATSGFLIVLHWVLVLPFFASHIAFAQSPDEFDLIDINEGELHFLPSPPAEPPHEQSIHISVNRASLKEGWVTVKQCHYHLGNIGALQIVFNKDRVRNLEIVQAESVGRAWVEGPTVQLTEVTKKSNICIVSENRSLRISPQRDSYEWHGGPYQRRFLDGYFPMHVKIAIDYPANLLQLATIEPGTLKLRAVTQPGHIRLNALFEGRLDVLVRFEKQEASPGIGWQ
jgi:hypothetical protein